MIIAVSSPGETSAPPSGNAGVRCDRVAEKGTDIESFAEGLERGQTGCLGEGVHIAPSGVKLTEPEVTLMSAPDESAELAGRLWVAPGADGVRIENLTLDGANPKGSPSPIISASDVVFRGNDVSNDHTAICFSIGDGPTRPSGVLIERNRIHDCGELPATNHHHGIYVVDVDGITIRDNWIYDNADRGIQLYPNADSAIITGNVIDGNGQGVIFAGDDDDVSENNLVAGNLITNSVIRFNVESNWDTEVGSGNVVRGNCIGGGARDQGNGGLQEPAEGYTLADNVIADPLYVGRDTRDFTLTDESPCAGILG